MSYVMNSKRDRLVRGVSSVAAIILVGATGVITIGGAAGASAAKIGHKQAQLSSMHDSKIASLVAPNGDQNPYGIAIVPVTSGVLTKGNLLVSDFNNAAGTSGAGTTILQVNPSTGISSVFYSGVASTGPVGIAINPVNDGVWLGDYGTATDGTASNDLLISPTGKLIANFNNASTAGSASFVGVWGQAVSQANGSVSFYWSNAGNATNGTGGGSVWRLSPHPTGTPNGQPVHSTYAEISGAQAATPAGKSVATAAGPQGMVFDPASGNLYETNSASNTLYAIPTAATATGRVYPRDVYQGSALASPENVVLDPLNGDLLVVNGGNNNLVEITPKGQIVATLNLGAHQPAGALFGLAATTDAAGNLVVYYVNDNENSLHALTCLPMAQSVAPACAIH